MGEISDAKTQAQLETIAASQRELTMGLGRLLQEVSGVRVDVTALAVRVGEVEARASRAERRANEAMQKADATASDTTGMHKSWAAAHEALRITVEGVKHETHAQTADLKRLVAAETLQENHRAWQKEQADAADKRRARWIQVLAAIATICAIVGSMYAAVKVLSPIVHQ